MATAQETKNALHNLMIQIKTK